MVMNTARSAGIELAWNWTEAELTGGVILWLTTTQAEFLRGRWLSANWRVDELVAMKETIISQNLLKTAFNAKLGLS